MIFMILTLLFNKFERIAVLLTLPNVLREISIKFPALSFNGFSEIVISKINARAVASSRRYHFRVRVVNDTFSP